MELIVRGQPCQSDLNSKFAATATTVKRIDYSASIGGAANRGCSLGKDAFQKKYSGKRDE